MGQDQVFVGVSVLCWLAAFDTTELEIKNTTESVTLPRFTSVDLEGKEKYRGMFEIQKSRYKTSSREIGLDIRTHASPKDGQDQVSGGVSVICWHAAPVAYVQWKPCTIR